ncbi:sulfur transferase domain-containing protein [Oleiagrimonas sp. C23AA]|uniref:beta-lactamase hydrolase domain-containing protein n=1 Tax=Oleiagrimonas sp. C23AA TaxID=2719047 RepID=UPI00141EF769|nr:sulfur transferase domain-containing protein [Oleiagrimonas sp. C23AA]NII11838.1 hypothetical protein [Oleiagrimonas sp. C23AA]
MPALSSHFSTTREGLVTCAGQPDPATLSIFAANGGGCVINLCPDEELPTGWDEQAVVHSLGMDYVQLPVSGSSGLTHWAAHVLAATLARHIRRPVLMHCADGQRAAALLALKSAWVDGADTCQAIEIGRGASLQQMEPAVRQLLGA